MSSGFIRHLRDLFEVFGFAFANSPLRYDRVQALVFRAQISRLHTEPESHPIPWVLLNGFNALRSNWRDAYGLRTSLGWDDTEGPVCRWQRSMKPVRPMNA